MKKSGFTLVELSIVLVIIGLLASGILVAQSLINAAEISSFVRQMQQYDIAVSNFKTTYKCLSGDCRAFGGDGDGLIEQAASGQDDAFTGEMAAFWNTLSALGMVKNKTIYSTNATSGIRAGMNVPSVEIGKNTGVIVACEWENSSRTPSDRQDYPDWDGRYNYYHLFSTAANTTNSLLAGVAGNDYSISATDALAVDKKMDDGNAIMGNVRVSSNYERLAFYNGSPTYNQTAGSGRVMPADHSQYNINSSSSYPCALTIPLLSQVGQK
jgi:prepilin-type N-terminal cleavage/methylation domain-containing protein